MTLCCLCGGVVEVIVAGVMFVLYFIFPWRRKE